MGWLKRMMDTRIEKNLRVVVTVVRMKQSNLVIVR